MRRVVAVLVGVLVLTGCTRSQIEAWVQWHDADPAGAETWLATDEAQTFLVEPSHAAAAPKWDAIAMCESGANWSHPPVTNRTGTYSGGLMIWTKAWIVYGGQQFAGQAYQATRNEQIVVAERIRADRGWGAWDCA